MAHTRRLSGTALLAALTLALGACAGTPEDPPTSSTTPPTSSSPGTLPEAEEAEVDLAPTDEITLSVPAMDPGGSYGEITYVVTEDTLTSSYTLRDDTILYSIPRPLPAADRERFEEITEAYVATAPRDRGPECPHGAAGTVEVSGSVTHLSEASPCSADSPMNALFDAANGLRDDDVKQLARPHQWWTVEIRPWEGGRSRRVRPGRELLAEPLRPPERDDHSGGEHPARVGGSLVLGPGDRETSLDAGGTAAVLTALNEVLLDGDPARCEDPTGEVRLLDDGDPELVRTVRLCPGDEPEVLVEELRAL